MTQQPQRRNHKNPRRNSDQRHRQNDRRQTEPCPEGISKNEMKAISAPYNFVPLATWVHIPSWGPQVSHDHPFRDGLSGEIRYTLTATSPLLVGGKQIKSKETRPGEWSVGEIKPFQTPDGRYAIPGSSLKGMIRTVIEIAGFGRMRLVDDARPGLRDISGKYVQEAYTSKVRDKVKTGFLRIRDDGKQEIVPCRMARLNHRDLESKFGIEAPIFKKRQSVENKYLEWQRLCKNFPCNEEELSFDLIGYEAKPSDTGKLTGYPVFTGQISDSTQPKGKYKDFVFYEPDKSQTIEVPEEVWRDFLFIHGNDEKKNNAMSWPGYWRNRFNQGKRVPVFYLQDEKGLRIGLAYMPKLAGDYSIHSLIEKTNSAHRQEPGEQNGYDLADLLFGSVNPDRQNNALRGRVSFETAIATGSPSEQQQTDTILNGPKPTYFPNYLTQKCDKAKGTLSNNQYATYIDTGPPTPSVRGFKRYPARPEAMTQVQTLTGEQKNNNKVKIRLNTLNQDAAFTGRIVFHNLKREELGALLWALTWDGKTELRHSLGMGKPFGFGQARIDIDPTSTLTPNDPMQNPGLLDEEKTRTLINIFKKHMEEAAKKQKQSSWETSPQIINLLAMADPDAADNWSRDGRELRHMHLIAKCKQPNGKSGANEFQWAKQQTPPFVLADYAAATGWDKYWKEEIYKQQAEAQRIAKEKAEAAKQAEIEAQTKGLPDDAAELVRKEHSETWRDKDNGQFVTAMLNYLEGKETLSNPACEKLTDLIEPRFPGLLENPRATTGKKAKPKFKPRQIEFAEQVLKLC